MAQEQLFSRIPLLVPCIQPAAVTGSASDSKFTLYGEYLKPAEQKGLESLQDTCFVLMHPNGVLQALPVPTGLAAAGLHTICCASRFIKNDTTLEMEQVVVDLGAVLKHCKSVLGFRRVVLVGWSGGASLSLFYQSQATRPTITHTPSGEKFDLSQAGLEKAFAVCIIAGHVSRAKLLSEWLDPAVTNELDPWAARDKTVDIFARTDTGTLLHPPPFSADFIAKYREKQLARMKAIASRCRRRLETLKALNMKEITDEAFVIHGTMADLSWSDNSLEPNDRPAGSCFFGPPAVASYKPGGMARTSTLRSFLSQWSLEDSNADGVVHGAVVDVPTIMFEYTADNACLPSHTQRLWKALSLPEQQKQFVVVKGQGHLYGGEEMTHVVRDWALSVVAKAK